jgi:excisionase family DNA binding protein
VTTLLQLYPGSAEAAAIVGVSPSTLKKWAERGYIRRFRLGPRSRYSRDELLNLAKEIRVGE